VRRSDASAAQLFVVADRPCAWLRFPRHLRWEVVTHVAHLPCFQAMCGDGSGLTLGREAPPKIQDPLCRQVVLAKIRRVVDPRSWSCPSTQHQHYSFLAARIEE